jgi:hypothetical protein
LEVCYDERGEQYKLPQYVYNNPVELTHNAAAPPLQHSVGSDETTDLVELSDCAEDTKNHIKLRIRINPGIGSLLSCCWYSAMTKRVVCVGDHNLQVSADRKYTILQLKQSVLREVTKTKPQLLPLEVERQRIMFLGRELANNSKVGDAGFDDSKVVQVFLRPKCKAT